MYSVSAYLINEKSTFRHKHTIQMPIRGDELLRTRWYRQRTGNRILLSVHLLRVLRDIFDCWITWLHTLSSSPKINTEISNRAANLSWGYSHLDETNTRTHTAPPHSLWQSSTRTTATSSTRRRIKLCGIFGLWPRIMHIFEFFFFAADIFIHFFFIATILAHVNFSIICSPNESV